MNQEQDVVTLVQARTGTEARVILALLEEAGIPAYIPGSMLTDEFAMSQKMLSGGAVEVQVPSSARERAQAILDQARESASFMDAETEDAEAEENEAQAEDLDDHDED